MLTLLSSWGINIFDDMDNINLKLLMQKSVKTEKRVPERTDMIADALIL
jgi:hypothetical protein